MSGENRKPLIRPGGLEDIWQIRSDPQRADHRVAIGARVRLGRGSRHEAVCHLRRNNTTMNPRKLVAGCPTRKDTICNYYTTRPSSGVGSTRCRATQLSC